MEGFLWAKVPVHALKAAGKALSRESLRAALEGLGGLNLGGHWVRLSNHSHNASTYVELSVVGSGNRVIK